MDFYDSWQFLFDHDMYKDVFGDSRFLQCTDIAVVKVNPDTNSIDDIEELNTKVQVWIETGEWDKEDELAWHDIELDCGGNTYEEAIIKLAELVDRRISSKKEMW